MTISKTNIFNMALNELGVSAPINNADSQSEPNAIILRNFYEIARDVVLKDYDWNFAEKYRNLTPTNDISLDPRFEYVYDYPNDCIAARDIFGDDSLGIKRKFKLSANNSGQKILLTTISPCTLRYTRRVENESLFDPEYASALALYLAGLAGNAITGSAQKANEALKKYYTKIKSSQVSNATEGQENDEDKTQYYDVR